MNPLGTRARAEELAALLDGAVAGPSSLTAPYAALATRLRALAPALDGLAVPRPDFRAALRQRLVAVATVQAAQPVPYAEPLARPRALDAAVTWTQSRKAQRRIGVTAGAMASVVALTGVGVAATRSLPGQPFYGLKGVGEDLQLKMADGDTAKGTKHLEFASTRLREIRALAHGEGQLSLGAPGQVSAAGLALGGSLDERIADTLKAFNEQTQQGTALLTGVYRKTGKPAPLRIITAFGTEQKTRLSALLPSLPAAVQPQAEDALELVTQVSTEATDLLALGTCGGSCYPGNAGPSLPAEPVPTPGATATPSGPADSDDDNNGVPACECGQPTVAPQPEATPAEEPTAEPSPTASEEPTPEPSPSPEPSLLPVPLPVPVPTLPVPVPTLPVPVPTLPVLPVPVESVLPTSLPVLPKS